jgi:hypothetical protein
VGGPEAQHRHQPGRADGGKDKGRHRKPNARADPPCKGIGDQPAGMGQRELRGEDSGLCRELLC